MQQIILECGEVHDFFNIKKIVVEEDIIEINGNYAKGKKYYTVRIREITIRKDSLKKLIKFLKTLKCFVYEGLCPYCETTKIYKTELVKRIVEVNNPKSKGKDIEATDENYFCGICKKKFDKDQMKYTDKTMYYK